MYTIKDYPLRRISAGDWVEIMSYQYQFNSNHMACVAGNDAIFKALGWDEKQKIAFFEKSYGYQSTGLWPSAKSRSDIVKSLNDLYGIILAKYNERPEAKSKVPISINEKSNCIEFSVYGEKIRIFGNPIYMLKRIDNGNKKLS